MTHKSRRQHFMRTHSHTSGKSATTRHVLLVNFVSNFFTKLNLVTTTAYNSMYTYIYLYVGMFFIRIYVMEFVAPLGQHTEKNICSTFDYKLGQAIILANG